MKEKPKRRDRQRWPFVKRRIYPNGSLGWMIDARTKSGGERRTFGTQREAETFADQCRIRRGNEGLSAFGNEDLARHGRTVQDAVSFYLEHLKQQERSVPVKTAIAELVEVRRGAGKSPRYCLDLAWRLGRFAKTFGERSAASVTAKEIDEWLTGLKLAASTRNTFRRDVRTLFSFCQKRGYSPENPAAATDRAKDVDKPAGILTVSEAARLLECCDAKTLPFVAISLFAGVRPEEVSKLDWSEVDVTSGFIEVKAHKAKTARRRLVRISDNLAAWLEPHVQISGPIAPPGLRRRLESIRRAAGFGTPGSETEDERKSGLRLKPWPKNACRHSFGSYWLAQNEDAAALALQMGNSQAMVFQHYRELVRPKDAARFWALSPSSEASAKVIAMA